MSVTDGNLDLVRPLVFKRPLLNLVEGKVDYKLLLGKCFVEWKGIPFGHISI